MENIDLINNFGKVFMINIYLYLIYIKITNYKNNTIKQTSIVLGLNIILSIIYTVLLQYVHPLIIAPVIYFFYGVIMAIITKDELNYAVFVTCVSFVITYMIYLVSVILSGIFLKILIPDISYRNPISLLTIPSIMYIIFYFVLRRKRVKYGFNFLNNRDKIETIGKFIIAITICATIIFGLLQDSENIKLNTYLTYGIILITITIIVWIQSQITLRYKENMKDRTIELQNEEIEKQSKKIEELKQENLKISSVVHQYNNRLSALEKAIVNKLKDKTHIEASPELTVMLEEVQNMSKDFSKEIATQIDIPLPKTNVMGIDNMFQYMAIKAKENNIQFNLNINHSIHYLIENIISKEELETLIGDHLNDAIIAINAKHTNKRKIMCILGKIEDYYELCIYDTGINFEIETLINLGRKRITTHKEDGGSGIGFMTSFETLRKCKGSLIIEEYTLDENYYTKSITFRFDGKNEYKICSSRVEAIRAKDKENRIILESK